MSVEKNMNTRIQHKHDTEANWNKAINFIPKIGEIIVYDIDENYNYSRFKIGDGVRTINNLEFSQADLTGYATEEYVDNAVTPFFIEITTEDMESGESNRTLEEISTAVASGKQLQLILNGSVLNVSLIGIDDELALFSLVGATDGGMQSNSFSIYKDKTVSILSQYIPQLPTDGIEGQFLSVNDDGNAVWVDKPTYTAADVGALPNTTTIPTKVSQLENDEDYLTRIVLHTNEYTPFEAFNVLVNPRYDGFIVHTDDTYGELGFSSYSLLISSGCAECLLTSDYNGNFMLFRLIGDFVHNTWSLKVENIGITSSEENFENILIQQIDTHNTAADSHNDIRLLIDDLQSKKPGEIVTGREYTIENEIVIAKPYAEVFNSNNIASGENSHAEGYNTTASGNYSHAEGNGAIVSGYASHAEGYETTASGNYSHAEGIRAVADGACSHAEGIHTTASSYCQHTQGKYNIVDANNKYAHIVGNGEVNSLSNAHTLDWNGNAWFAGDVYVGSTSGKNKDEGSKKLVTEAELASLIAQITEAVSQKSQVQLITWEADD